MEDAYRLRAALEALAVVPPLKLRALAHWLDVKHPEGSDEVQRDLRLMADLAELALGAAA